MNAVLTRNSRNVIFGPLLNANKFLVLAPLRHSLVRNQVQRLMRADTSAHRRQQEASPRRLGLGARTMVFAFKFEVNGSP